MKSDSKKARFKSDENTELMMENEKNIAKMRKQLLFLMDKSFALRNVFNENFDGLKHCRKKRNDTSK